MARDLRDRKPRTISDAELKKLWTKSSLLTTSFLETNRRQPPSISKLLTTRKAGLEAKSGNHNTKFTLRDQLVSSFNSRNAANSRGKNAKFLETSRRMLQTQNSFFFQQRHGKLDLRSIIRLDLSKVIEEVDVDTLQHHIENLTFARLEEAEMRNHSDESFLKLFQLMQLTLEYLLNVQSTLYSYSNSLESQLVLLQQEHEVANSKLSTQDQALSSLNNELQEKRRVLKTYEFLLMKHQSNVSSPKLGQESKTVIQNGQGSDEITTTTSADQSNSLKELLQREIDTIKKDLQTEMEKRLAEQEAELAEKRQVIDTLQQQVSAQVSDHLAKLRHELHKQQGMKAEMEKHPDKAQQQRHDLLGGFKESFAGELMNDNSDEEGAEAAGADVSPIVEQLREELRREKEGKFLLLSKATKALHKEHSTSPRAAAENKPARPAQEEVGVPTTLMSSIASSTTKGSSQPFSARNVQLRRVVRAVKRRLESRAFRHWLRVDAIQKTSQEIESQYFRAGYEWTVLPKALHHSVNPGLEVKWGDPALCRVPFSWVLSVPVSGGTTPSCRRNTVRVQVTRTESLDDVRLSVERLVDLGQANLCLSLRDAQGRPLSLVDTVETSDLFHRRVVAEVVAASPADASGHGALKEPLDVLDLMAKRSVTRARRRHRGRFSPTSGDGSSTISFGGSDSPRSTLSSLSREGRHEALRRELRLQVDEEMRQRGFPRTRFGATQRGTVSSPVRKSMVQLEGTIDSLLEGSAQKAVSKQLPSPREDPSAAKRAAGTPGSRSSGSWSSSDSSSVSHGQRNELSGSDEDVEVQGVSPRDGKGSGKEAILTPEKEAVAADTPEEINDVKQAVVHKEKLEIEELQEPNSISRKQEEPHAVSPGRSYDYETMDEDILNRYLAAANKPGMKDQRRKVIRNTLVQAHNDVISSLLSDHALQSDVQSFVASVDSGSSRSDTSESAHSHQSSAYDSEGLVSEDSFSSSAMKNAESADESEDQAASKSIASQSITENIEDDDERSIENANDASVHGHADDREDSQSPVPLNVTQETDYEEEEDDLEEIEDSLEYSEESQGLNFTRSTSLPQDDELETSNDQDSSQESPMSVDAESIPQDTDKPSPVSARSLTPPLVGTKSNKPVNEVPEFMEDIDDLTEEFGFTV